MTRSLDLRRKLNSHIASKIRDRRATVGLPQRELAEAIGISQQAMSKLESGKTTIAADTLWWIAVVLGTSMDFYFDQLPREYQAGGAMLKSAGSAED